MEGEGNVSYADNDEVLLNFFWPTELEMGLVVVYAIQFFIGLIGNSLVVFVVLRNQNMRTATNIFLVNLAVADLLVLILCLPSTVFWELTRTWWFGTPLCKATMFFQSLSVTVSILTLVCISVERWYAICNPLRFRITYRVTRNLLLSVWTVGVVLSLPEPITVTAKSHDWNDYFETVNYTSTWGTHCSDNWGDITQQYYQLTQTIVLFIIPLIIISILYGQVSYVLWFKSLNPSDPMRPSCMNSPAVGTPLGTPKRGGSLKERSSRNSTGPQLSGSSASRSVTNRATAMQNQANTRRKAAKMLIAVVILFTVCYLPVHLNNNLLAFKVDFYLSFRSHAHRTVMALHNFVVRASTYTASTANPVLYNFMSEKFQREFRRACCLKERRNRPSLFTRGGGTELLIRRQRGADVAIRINSAATSNTTHHTNDVKHSIRRALLSTDRPQHDNHCNSNSNHSTNS